MCKGTPIRLATGKNVAGSSMGAPRIPRIIHMTCPDAREIKNPLWAGCLKKWRDLHPEYDIRVRGDAEVETFLRKHAPNAVERWKAMPVGAVRADVYRYLVLRVEGGIYADMDCEPVKSIETLRAQYDKPGGPPPVVLGLEISEEYHSKTRAPGSFRSIRVDPRWSFRGLCLCQWCAMAAPGSKAMEQAFLVSLGGLSRIRNAIIRGHLEHDTITAGTGPVAMTKAILSSPRTRAGVHIISSEFFCAGSHGVVPLTAKSYVKHHFSASWKQGSASLGSLGYHLRT